MVFGVKEDKTPMRQEREKEKDVAGKLVGVASNEADEYQSEIEEVSRIGIYEGQSQANENQV
ncbi:hypothetical protein E2C01_099322 [Portunus trituberculatus]|uniref:Uncharacterized protein n=1 Tax=Portunus trituberculatus TaxID=210409 RepID=A0A5B7KGK3_PORTR|nr:hypothetical protein [Portunus trituberculatus]